MQNDEYMVSLGDWLDNTTAQTPDGTTSIKATADATDHAPYVTHSAQVDVPHRPAAPTEDRITATPAARGASNGSIEITRLGSENYQYSSNNGTSWTDMPGGNTVTGLAAGTYLVRVANADDASGNALLGNFAGVAAEVEIPVEQTVTVTFDYDGTTSDFGKTTQFGSGVSENVVATKASARIRWGRVRPSARCPNRRM